MSASVTNREFSTTPVVKQNLASGSAAIPIHRKDTRENPSVNLLMRIY